MPSIKTLPAPIALTIGLPAGAEVVTEYDLKRDISGYPCLLSIKTDGAPEVSIQLSDYEDVWSLNLYVSGVPEVYRRFFDEGGLIDQGELRDGFSHAVIGSKRFDINEVSLWVVQKAEVDSATDGIFRIKEKHNVARAIEAMKSSGIGIPELVSVEETIGATSDFRICALEAMGLRDGEHVEVDTRAEYRMIFEQAFEAWVQHMATAEICLVARYDDDAVAEVASQAASAFYPGMLNMMKRREYRDDLLDGVSSSKLTGTLNGVNGDCLMAGRLVDITRMPVDRSIEAARDLD